MASRHRLKVAALAFRNRERHFGAAHLATGRRKPEGDVSQTLLDSRRRPMKTIATMGAFAAALAFASATRAHQVNHANQTYSISDLVGGYSCTLSGTLVASDGTVEHTVGTGYIVPSGVTDEDGNGIITASKVILNIETIGNCEYSLDSDNPGTYRFQEDGLIGAAAGAYVLEPDYPTTCKDRYTGLLAFTCSGGKHPTTCYINTVDSVGKSMLSGTCTKQFPGMQRIR